MTTLINFNLKKKTGVCIFPDNKTVRKFVISKDKKNLIDKELKGVKWYFSVLKKKGHFKEKYIFSIGKNYLDFKLLNSPKYFFWDSITKNQKIIETAIEHYLKIWPRNKKTYFHGDLTVENILLHKGKPIFIDWENFKKNLPWGLDICFFLISALILPHLNKKNNNLEPSEKKIFKKIWNNFYFDQNYDYLNDPFKFSKKKKLFNNNHFINKIPKKFKEEIILMIKDKAHFYADNK